MSDSPIVAGATGLRSYEEYLNSSKKRVPVQELGQDQFLHLMVTQMQYQNPLEPTTDTAFVAQMAQFSSLNQLSALNSTISSLATMQGYSLAGKYVAAEIVLDNGEKVPVAGVVDRIVNMDGKTWVQVGEYLIDASKISQVFDGDQFNYDNTLLETSSLIGRTVKGYLPGEELEGGRVGDPIEVEGVVEKVAYEKDGQVAYINTGRADEQGNPQLVKVNVGTIFHISK